MKDEIYELPYRAELCYKKNKGLILPEDIPYIAMGASHIATKAFRYMGINFFPEKAAEYFNYLLRYMEPNKGVLISQSGQSPETLWCADYFKSFVAIVNDENSPLSKHANCSKMIMLHSGEEKCLPTKTYINTLIVLYLGFGFDPLPAIEAIRKQEIIFEKIGEEIGKQIYAVIHKSKRSCTYVLGNGPNIATANIASLVLSKVIKVPVLSMSASQYDHGYKETAKDSMVIAINHEGIEMERTRGVLEVVKKAGAETFEITNSFVDSLYSPVTLPMAFYFAAEYLARKLKIKSFYEVGNKVVQITVPDGEKDE